MTRQHGNAPALHVMGCPRSGTTLMAEMIHACYEAIDYPCHEENIFRVPVTRSRIRLSKKPNDLLWIRPVLETCTDLHGIVMLRDPRAVIASEHRGHPGRYFCNYPVWKRAARRLDALYDNPRCLVVCYEQLIRDPERVQDELEARFPFLRRCHDFRDFHHHSRAGHDAAQALGGIRELQTDRLQGWQRHPRRLREQLQRHPALQEDLEKFGYETGEGWQRKLEDVTPVCYPCRYPETVAWYRKMAQVIRMRLRAQRYIRRWRARQDLNLQPSA